MFSCHVRWSRKGAAADGGVQVGILPHAQKSDMCPTGSVIQLARIVTNLGSAV